MPPPPLPRTARDATRRIRMRIEEGDPVAARKALNTALWSPGFEAAFERGDVRGWPVGVLPDLPVRALAGIHEGIPGVLSTPRIITDRMRRGKLRVRHPEVGIEQYRMLQTALDRGELLLHSPQRGRKLTSLIVHAPRVEGGWWRYAIKIDARGGRLWLSTIHATSDRKRADRVAAGADRVVRAWATERWSGG